MLKAKVVLAFVLLLVHGPAAVARAQGPDSVDLSDYVDLGELESPGAIEHRIRHMLRDHESQLERVIRNGTTKRGNFTLAEGDSLVGHLLVVRGNADIYGKLLGNLVALDGNVTVHRSGSIAGEVVTFNGTIDNEGDVTGTARAFGSPTATPTEATPSALATTGQRLAGTIGVFLTLLALGIGLVLFARPRLEVVADTTAHSFTRSLVAGFVGQILALPTLGIMVVGLIVSVVGIVLLPFAVVAYALLVGIGIGGGTLAAAHAIGETYVRRRQASGATTSPNSYRYIALGLGALAVPSVIGALFGWVPIVGPLLRTVACLAIWLALTAGSGAVLLSRGGSRTTFTGWDA